MGYSLEAWDLEEAGEKHGCKKDNREMSSVWALTPLCVSAPSSLSIASVDNCLLTIWQNSLVISAEMTDLIQLFNPDLVRR